ncbi:uncharacterized protein FFE2_02031 [Fusarium fujikuroi]|nr:uncharacterized protein FFE2_02031 [Fusarium fujikuroi]
MTKNQILFSVDNQTPFTLVPNPTTFSDWGDFAAGPTTLTSNIGHADAATATFVLTYM